MFLKKWTARAMLGGLSALAVMKWLRSIVAVYVTAVDH